MDITPALPIATRLLDEHEVAAIRNQSVATIRRERLRQSGVRFLKLGGSVRYRHEDVMAWINSRPSGGAKIEAA